MKKPLLLTAIAASLLIPATANAQSRELKRDRQEIRNERQDVRQAQRYGTPKQVQNQRKDVRQAKREYRQDWRSYRNSNRNAFKRTVFRAPFRYSSFRIGASINSRYYGSPYTLSNYSYYRLPAPGRNQRYVRHYDDVLLVNIRTGRVIQVYNNFYW